MAKLTTIQMHTGVKRALDRVKDHKESYEEAVLKLIEKVESQRVSQEKLMVEGCKEMAGESLKVLKDWSAAETDWD